jgi:hypothetical protein
MEILPLLIEILDDDTQTELIVSYVGGHAAVGDVALIAITHIIGDFPTQKLIGEQYRNRWETIGIGAYYEYVRASKENRSIFKENARDWIEKNKDTLIWEPLPKELNPAGGYWVQPK